MPLADGGAPDYTQKGYCCHECLVAGSRKHGEPQWLHMPSNPQAEEQRRQRQHLEEELGPSAKRQRLQGEGYSARRLAAEELERPSISGAISTSCWSERIPRLDPWGRDRGRLVEALSRFGVVFLQIDQDNKLDRRLPQPLYGRWYALWSEAVKKRAVFSQRPAVQQRLLSFNRSEDLARTLEGDTKVHAPDKRYNFGVSWWNGLHRTPEEWGCLNWIADNFRNSLSAAVDLVRQELLEFLPNPGSGKDMLEAKLQHYSERWGGSRLRHSVYPNNGSCTEHTDYGVLTLQQSTAAGLEGELLGEWVPVEPPEGCAVAFAGDMLQLLTNGRVPALRHRVSLDAPCAGQRGSDQAFTVVRQSHILFVQPDKNTVVQPLHPFRRGDGTDLPAIRYGDWHNEKANLAFTRS